MTALANHRHPAFSPLSLLASGYLSRREYKQQTRIGAVYRLLRKRHLGQRAALEILSTVFPAKEMQTVRATVELWKTNHHFREAGGMLP